MRGGHLRHSVTLQERTTDQDETGAQIETWADVATVWGAVEPLSGRELFTAQQVKAEVTAQITIRYRSGISATMRIVFEGRLYNILAVIDPEERHRELQLLCSEGLNDG